MLYQLIVQTKRAAKFLVKKDLPSLNKNTIEEKS